ncbi:MAG: TlpA family protein disulfide reductase [Mesorhizobium sp.]|nr:TlpA family protein disulfide reductase [Mesorhizobium sp.]
MRFSSLNRTVLAVGVAAVAGVGAGALLIATPLSSWWSSAQPQTGAVAEISGFQFQAEDGSTLTLENFRGRAVLLNVWATWCPPCRKEMPSLDRLQAMKGGDRFEVVALSIDKGGADQVKPFYGDVGIEKLKMYLDAPGASMRALKIVGLPTTLLIGPDGRELARWAGPREWDEPAVVAEIDALLAAQREG